MIDLEQLKTYFAKTGTTKVGAYRSTTTIQQDEDETFSINKKAQQDDTKEEHLVKIRLGLERHRERTGTAHRPDQPHFELDHYKTDGQTFAATLYFEFDNPTDEELMGYAKGTVVLITKMLQRFFTTHHLPKEELARIVATSLVQEELASYEQPLIDALYHCYKNSALTVRRKGMPPLVIKTEHNLKKHLGHRDLKPLYTPLLERIREEEK